MMVARKARRNTRQRRVVLEELQKVTSHPTAAELFDLARRRLPGISLGTVYSNLELLSRTGVIRKLEISGSAARFDGNPDRHCHVRCIRCGRVDDVHDVPADLAKIGGSAVVGDYEILECDLRFVGICPECRRHPARDDGSLPAGDV
jgi:Fur family ferric uptake transcriptional regulator